MKKARFCMLGGCIFSCGIEMSQLIIGREYCQLDDMVTNTVEILVGWLIWRGMRAVRERNNK